MSRPAAQSFAGPMFDATPFSRLYAVWRRSQLAFQDAVWSQKWQLKGLLRRAAQTQFGREHGFSQIRNVGEYQAQVGLRSYDGFWRDYWQAGFPRLTDVTWPGTIPYFALTAGTTTGKTKYIPCSSDMNQSNLWAAIDLLVHHLANRPASAILGGKSFMLGGSTDLAELAPGIYAGDLSGIAVKEIPWWARPRYFPPLDLALIADWEEKIGRLAPLSLEEDIRAISGTPSWLLLFIDKLMEYRPGAARRLVELYPNLELIAHGGVNFAPYRRQFEELLEGSRAETREVYPASEGFLAIADRGPDEGLRLILDNGIFFEFVPVEELERARPTRHWIGNAEIGVNYAIVLSTCAGLWGYILGDTVRFVELRPPRILVTGRTAYSLSAFGEHLINEEIEQSIARAAQEIGAVIADYAVGPVFPEHPGELGGHLYVVEFVGMPQAQAMARFAEILDHELAARNEDYRAHRSHGFGMKSPTVLMAKPGSFAAWMKARGKLGGQHKVPRVINDPALLRELRDFVSGGGPAEA
jgi:hypothetical protein